MTSWCEKHHLFAGFASSNTWLLLLQLLDSPIAYESWFSLHPSFLGWFLEVGAILSHDLEHLQQLNELRIELISAQLHHALLARQSIIGFLLEWQVGVRNIIFLLVLHLRIHDFSCFSCLTPQRSRQNVRDVFATTAENTKTAQISPWVL